MIPKKIHGRKAERSLVTPFEIKGELSNVAGDISEAVLIWNISDTGLCVWATHKFKHGDAIALKIQHPWVVTLNLVVRWSRNIPDRSGVLLGLEAIDDQTELIKLHKNIMDQQKVG